MAFGYCTRRGLTKTGANSAEADGQKSEGIGMKCFVISPIGEDNSSIRTHADEVFEHILKPALSHFDIEPVRSDRMAEPGRISDQMYRAIFQYDLCVAVLTFANPNVYYELALAQSTSRPVIILIEKGETLPFDVKDFRTLTYDLSISSYKQGTYINRLIGMLNELKQSGWIGDDVFRAYRSTANDPIRAKVDTYGIRISDPADGAQVDVVDVHGTYQLIPPGYELRSLRYYPRQHGFVPQGSIGIDQQGKAWHVSGFDIGGKSGEERGIEIALAGPSARILLDYWREAHEAHSEVHRRLRATGNANGPWLPPIRSWPDDLITCHRKLVRRK